jgi:UDP-glucose 4-epimerase
LSACLEDAQRVFHLAAIPSVPRSVRDPLLTHESTLTATVRLLIAARDAGSTSFVLSSSSSVYGNSPEMPKRESLPVRPISPYGVAKAGAEAYTRVFGELYGMRTVILRYFNVFGPAQDPASAYAAVIPLFVTGALAGRPITIFGDGRQTRDFTYVDNVVEANLAAASAEVRAGSVYNVAAGEPHSLLDLVGELGDVIGERLKVRYQPPRPGDIVHSSADITLALNELDWKPHVRFAAGLRRTVDWYRSSVPLRS